MKKRTLARDIKKCFAKSKGRFISIVCLIALGSFALVGLQVAGLICVIPAKITLINTNLQT